MSLREAARQASTDIPTPRSGKRHYVAGSGAVTATERALTADGVKAGAKLREREAAADAIRTLRALAAERPLSAAEAGALAEADAILAEAEARAAKAGRAGRWALADASRMSGADVARLAAYSRRCAERMARPKLSEAEAEDIEADALAAILTRADSADGAALWRMPYGTPRADARLRLAEAALADGGALPRWDALSGADAPDLAGTRHDGAAEGSRDRWRGFAYLEARAAIRRRHERLSAETPADWTPADDGAAPSPEQRAALAADNASSALSDALAADAVTHGVYALAVTASAPLSAPERDALALALSGQTRAQIAAARGVTTEAVKQGGKRGRAALAKRTPERADAQQWARAATRRMRHFTRPDERSEAERAMTREVAAYRGVRLSWPDRMAPCDGGSTGHVPAPITGTGTRANVPAVAADPARGYKALPRRTERGRTLATPNAWQRASVQALPTRQRTDAPITLATLHGNDGAPLAPVTYSAPRTPEQLDAHARQQAWQQHRLTGRIAGRRQRAASGAHLGRKIGQPFGL